MPARSRLVVALLAVAIATGGAAANNNYKGKQFPDFKAKDAVTGKPLTLKSLRGKVVLIDFWATWCGPCIGELPNVQKTYKAYKDKGFEIISVSLDSDRNKFSRFVKSRKMTWRHVMEGGGWKTRLARKYGINSIPAMYLLDHNGVCISDRARGPALGRAVRDAVARIPAGTLKRPPGGADKAPAAGDVETGDVHDVEDTGVDIGDSQRVLVQIAEVHESLTAAAAPIAEIGQRLARVGKSINSIDRGMPNPDSPSSLRRRYISMHDELTAIRNEMYVCGMLNETAPTLPGNPFEDTELDQRRGLTLAWGELPSARGAVEELGLLVNVVSRQVHSAESKLDRVERRLARDPSSVTQAERAEALVNATRLATRCRDAWATQMGVVDRTLERRPGAESAKLRSELAKLKAMLAGTDVDLAAARRRFTAICGRVLTMN